LSLLLQGPHCIPLRVVHAAAHCFATVRTTKTSGHRAEWFGLALHVPRADVIVELLDLWPWQVHVHRKIDVGEFAAQQQTWDAALAQLDSNRCSPAD
jgi:hypothetical protein